MLPAGKAPWTCRSPASRPVSSATPSSIEAIGYNGEASVVAGFDDVLAQHKMLDVGVRDQYALRSRETTRSADVEEPLDLFVDAADRLYVAELVYRAGNRKVLSQGRVGQSRQERIEFS